MQGSQCLECKWFEGATVGNLGLKCKAFPDGISAELLSGVTDHTKPVDGDHGIQFEEREG